MDKRAIKKAYVDTMKQQKSETQKCCAIVQETSEEVTKTLSVSRDKIAKLLERLDDTDMDVEVELD